MSWSNTPDLPKYKGITIAGASVLGVLGILSGGLLGYGLYQHWRTRSRQGPRAYEPRDIPDSPSGWSSSYPEIGASSPEMPWVGRGNSIGRCGGWLKVPYFEVDDGVEGMERLGPGRADSPNGPPYGEAPDSIAPDLSPVAGTSAQAASEDAMLAAPETMIRPIGGPPPRPPRTFAYDPHNPGAASMPRAAGETRVERVGSRSAVDDEVMEDMLRFGF